MLTSLRQNPAIRTLPRWLGITGATTALFVNVLLLSFLKDDRMAGQLSFVFIVWLAVTLYLVFGEVRTRCTPFDMALPISSRKLWLSHLLAVLVSGVAIFAATAGPVAGVLWVIWKVSGKWLVSAPGLGGLTVHVCSGLTLAVVLLQNPTPASNKLPRTRERVLLAALVMVSVLAMVLLLSRLSPWAALVTLGLALSIGLYRYRSVPEVFELSGEDGAAAAERLDDRAVRDLWAAVGAEARPRGVSFGWRLNRTIWRTFQFGVKVKRSPLITTPFVLIFGIALSGLDGLWISEGTLQLLYVPLVAYTLMSFTAHPFNTTHLVDALPISRRRILNVLVIPYTIILVVGYGAGNVIQVVLEREGRPQRELIHFIQHRTDGNYYLYVPPTALEIAWDGKPPRTVAPWGEEHESWSRPVFRGGRVRAYSPYHTPPECSIEYAAWQISRAVEAVYGELISPDLIRDRYLRERTDGSAALVGGSLTIQEDFPHLRRVKESGPLFPVLMAAVWTLWMLSIAIFLRTFRAGVSKARRNTVLVGILVVLMLMWIVEGFVAPVAKLVYIEGYLAVAYTLFARAGQSVGQTAAVWLVSLLVSLGTYQIALRQFARAEALHGREVSIK